MLIKNPHVTLEQIAKDLNLSKSTVKRNLKELITSGNVSREGSKKTGQWVVHDKS
ncbi:MAG: winged helix-turn-helix transcriptional regulator [Firmicutes bacterium]|nr:winged helix-turn-helix transcriptional regulator [Bacillota bacterium]